MKRLAILAAVVAACSSSHTGVPPVRFANEAPALVVNDRLDVPKKPAAREFDQFLFHLNGTFRRPLTRALELPKPVRAKGVNALDEVPDSTWFTNRITARDITPDEIRAAPGGVGSPEDYLPWTVESSKVGGVTIGFIFHDNRGEKWLLKFDNPKFPEMETGAHVIVDRLLWAAGYNVTEDYIAYVHPEDLVVGKGAVMKNKHGKKTPLTQEMLAAALAPLEKREGRMRCLVSRMLTGEALGGHPPEGVRKDDPNDRIAHELRRDLRGTYTLFSWLDHEDIHGANSLDAWVTDPKDPKRHYLKHYWIDFGNSLGVMGTQTGDLRRGHEYTVDVAGAVSSLVTLGASQREWDGRKRPAIRGVPAIDTVTFDPGRWKPSTPWYIPFQTADRFDKFWGAKIVMRFTPDQLHAAAEAARFTDPRANDFIVNALVDRQRKIGRYWFSRVNPLDGFAFHGEEVCFDDLARQYGFLGTTAPTSYSVTSYSATGQRLTLPILAYPDSHGRACVRPTLSNRADGYTILRVDTVRSEYAGTTYVHVARHATGPRVVGIWRQ